MKLRLYFTDHRLFSCRQRGLWHRQAREQKAGWNLGGGIGPPRSAQKNSEEGKGIRCVIEGTKVVAKLPGEGNPAGTLIIKIDAREKLKTMDIRSEREKDTILAIYELEGNILRVCWSPLGKERPTEFASKPGTGHALVVLKREKP